MNSIIEAIKKRRSVRSYDAKPVPLDFMNAIIEAANEAPSAMNSQPWRFVIIEDKDARKKLLNAALPKAKKMTEDMKAVDPQRYETIKKRYVDMPDPIYYSAPAIVFVIGSGQFAAHSCPLACENMMLAAYSLGLGSCWVGLGAAATDDPDVRSMLELREGDAVFGPLLIGYPKTVPARPAKKEPKVKWI